MRHRSHIRATFQLNLLGIFHVIEGQKGTHTHTQIDTTFLFNGMDIINSKDNRFMKDLLG